MFNSIMENFQADLENIYLEESKKETSMSGVSFKDYDTYLELKDIRLTLDNDKDKKWFAKVEKQVAKLKKNKKDFDKFIVVYKKGNWK